MLHRNGIILSDELIERHYPDLVEVLDAQEACKACSGREKCTLPTPGMVPRLIPRGDGVVIWYTQCAQDESYKRMKRIEDLMQSSRLPEHLRGQMFETFEVTEENRQAFILAQRVAMDECGKGLVLAGSTGTGKTHLAAAILNARIKAGQEAIFCTVPELLADIRRTIKSGEGTSELLEIVKDAKLLILDDLGTEKTTEWVVEQLFVVINARLLRVRQTVVTTNFANPSELIEKLGGLAGQRIVSRLCEMCDWVRLGGKDWRLRTRNRRAESIEFLGSKKGDKDDA